MKKVIEFLKLLVRLRVKNTKVKKEILKVSLKPSPFVEIQTYDGQGGGGQHGLADLETLEINNKGEIRIGVGLDDALSMGNMDLVLLDIKEIFSCQPKDAKKIIEAIRLKMQYLELAGKVPRKFSNWEIINSLMHLELIKQKGQERLGNKQDAECISLSKMLEFASVN